MELEHDDDDERDCVEVGERIAETRRANLAASVVAHLVDDDACGGGLVVLEGDQRGF